MKNRNPTTAASALHDHLMSLVGKKVQIFYVGEDQEETTAAGRLLSVTPEIIKIEGALTTTTLFRKAIRIGVIDHVAETETLDTAKLIIRKIGNVKLTARVFHEIGKLIDVGQRAGDNKPKGFSWAIVQWNFEEKVEKEE